MDVTEDLTNKARGGNKSFLAAANGEVVVTLETSPQWKCSKAWEMSRLMSYIVSPQGAQP